jgi:membrane protein required for colicin V production
MESLNGLDICILTILIISAVLAYLRGFIHEILSLAGWIGASLAVLYILPLVRPVAQDIISSKMVADAAASITIFTITLIVLTLTTHYISDKIRESQLNILDRTAGFAFGLGRGVLFLSLGYVFASMFINEKNKPEMVENSKTLFVIEYAVDIMKEIVPDDFMPSDMYNIGALKGEPAPIKDDEKINEPSEDKSPLEAEQPQEPTEEISKLQLLANDLQKQITYLEENGSIADLETLTNLKNKYDDVINAINNATKSSASKIELDNKIDDIYNLLTQPKVDAPKDNVSGNAANDAEEKQNKESGYSSKERLEMDRLIDSNQ